MFPPHITHDEIEAMPYVAFGGSITVVEKPEQAVEAGRYLMQETLLGYDTESRPSFERGVRYGLSLVQLSSASRAFLFRVDKMGVPPALVEVLQSPKILKVGAAIGEDIHGVQRLCRFTPDSFVDLQKMVEAYGIEDKALKKMAAIVLGLRISKSQQTSNWAASRYSDEQKSYAATDAWICREIYLKLLTITPPPAPPKAAAPAPAPTEAKPKRRHRRGHRGGRRRYRKPATAAPTDAPSADTPSAALTPQA
ncbi:MAG: 3'-5' exonuclease domain-containing protein 2 [Prevotellaceae bacterium]|jgi:hypothetical protein|nr:3'-5' exonuclease domain-containing protein 2 [Prevotellaceae bacterium]